MKVVQDMLVRVKSGTSVVLQKFISGQPTAYGDGEAHPNYEQISTASLVMVNSIDTGVTSLWACPGVMRVIIERKS